MKNAPDKLPLAHALLLNAVWTQGAEFPAAWAKWREAAAFDQLDHDSYSLLPALFRNLERHNLDDELRPRLAGVYRQTFYANQLLRNQIAEIGAALAEIGVTILLLPRTALSLVYQDDLGLYPLATGEMLVRPEDAPRAAAILAQYGWQSRAPERRRPFSPLYRALTFTNAEGLRLALYWHPLVCGADNALWDNSLTTNLRGVSVRVMAPTDALAEVCAEAGLGPRLGWMSIVLALLHTQEIDWPEFPAHPVAAAGLSWLAAQVAAPLTPEVLSQLPAAQKISWRRTRAGRLWQRYLCHHQRPGGFLRRLLYSRYA